ncbi:hypothetical protein [Leptolyngbya sp. FACHB-16]|uniref:hypothetical protein n=1 Tax=unclassified Leptolyngbya TaxID=2650499 RepID=UPI0016867396|nr:hypothetical protein [Leptolyngbya sp. FACHB-16]MBD1911925.1 hypothetical protein [Leptolyngbya sp. FACHB-8]
MPVSEMRVQSAVIVEGRASCPSGRVRAPIPQLIEFTVLNSTSSFEDVQGDNETIDERGQIDFQE